MAANCSSIRAFVLYCSVLVVAIFIQSALANDSGKRKYDEVKMRRGGNVGLFPFPRVGRSDPEIANYDQAAVALINSLEDYNDLYRTEVKRQGLMPFPRVGRSGYKPIWIQAPLVHSSSRVQKRSPALE